MKIFGICLVKNEEDIIEYTLTKASEWADKIFVYDNGSTDRTWEIVQEMAKENPVIHPWKSEAKPFRDGLRGNVYTEFKHFAKNGDWWCVRLDSDEVYLDDPRIFLKEISRLHHVVTSLHFEYKLAKEDIEEFEFKDRFDSESAKQLNYYSKKVTSEIRFIKHRNRMIWPENYGYPKHKGVISPKKIRIKHLQYRTPKQIQKRIEARIQATKEGYKFFGRDNVDSWKDKLENRIDLVKEGGEYSIGWLQDKNKSPWYIRQIKILLHLFRIFP